MKTFRALVINLLAFILLLSTCSTVVTEEPAQLEKPAAFELTEELDSSEAPIEKSTVEPLEEMLTCYEPIKVGVITDATGALGIYGAHIIRSFMLGMEYATGAPGSVGKTITVEDGENTFMLDNCKIAVFLGDDQTKLELTTSIAREFVEVIEVDILVGSAGSDNSTLLQKIAAENQIPLIVAPAAANEITGVNFNEYTFRTSRNNYQDAINLCEYFTTVYTDFVQIVPDYGFGSASAKAFRDSCTFNSGSFVTDDIFIPLNTTDFTPYVEPILESGAESLIVSWAGEGFTSMMKSAVDVGLSEKMAVGVTFVDNITLPVFFSDVIGSTGGILYHYTVPDNEINDWMVTQNLERYKVYPDLFDADGFNAALMIVEGLKATGGDANANTLIEAFEGMEFDGPKGTIYIRPEDHVAVQDMYIVTLLNTDNPEAKFFEYVKTTRPEPPCLLPDEMKDRCSDLPYGSLRGK